MTTLLTLAVLALIIYGLLSWNVAKLKQKPRPYSFETLSANPQGEEVMIPGHDGNQIRAISAGEGPTIVFAHGYGASLVEWNIMADQLVKEGFRIIAFDQRGHTDSTIGTEGIGSQQMAAAYKSVLEHFDVQDGILVGHSMGGFLGFVFMLTYPEVVKKRLRGALIMASFAGDVYRNNTQNKVQIPLIKHGIMTRVAHTETLGYPFGRSLLGEKPDAAMIQAFLDVFKKQNHQALVPILSAFGDENYYSRLGEIEIPCTIIVGEKDHTTPPFHTDEMAEHLQTSKVVRLPGMGHMLNWEAPEALMAEIRVLAGKVAAG
ncbi:MAG: alpha/beta hydrolase [Bacteroidota bacterium]